VVSLIASLAAYSNPRIRNIEQELPDAIPDEPDKVVTQPKTEGEPESPELSTVEM
jgi:hypothetical protein